MASLETFRQAYTNTYGVQFANRASGGITCDPDEDPIAVAGTLGTVIAIDARPYPARPVRTLAGVLPLLAGVHGPNILSGELRLQRVERLHAH